MSPPALMPPSLVRTPIQKDFTFVGNASDARKKSVAEVTRNIDGRLAFFLAKYPFVGIGIYLYFTSNEDLPTMSALLSNSQFKTADEKHGLTQVYANASVTDACLRAWKPFVRELTFDVVLKQLVNFCGFDEIFARGSIVVEMPDKSGMKIWIEGTMKAGRNDNGFPFVCYIQSTRSWAQTYMLTAGAGSDYRPMDRFYTTEVGSKARCNRIMTGSGAGLPYRTLEDKGLVMGADVDVDVDENDGPYGPGYKKNVSFETTVRPYKTRLIAKEATIV